MTERTCIWTPDADGDYDTQCGELMVSFGDTFKEQGFVYCPFCGGHIEEEKKEG